LQGQPQQFQGQPPPPQQFQGQQPPAQQFQGGPPQPGGAPVQQAGTGPPQQARQAGGGQGVLHKDKAGIDHEKEHMKEHQVGSNSTCEELSLWTSSSRHILTQAT
jgi:hypothetical protein